MYKNIYNSYIHNNKKVETSQTSFSSEIKNSGLFIKYKYYMVEKNEQSMHSSIWTNLMDIRLNQRSQTQSRMWQTQSVVTPPNTSYPYPILAF